MQVAPSLFVIYRTHVFRRNFQWCIIPYFFTTMQKRFVPNRQALTGRSRDCMIQLDNEGDEPASSARRCFIGEETNQTLALNQMICRYISGY